MRNAIREHWEALQGLWVRATAFGLWSEVGYMWKSTRSRAGRKGKPRRTTRRPGLARARSIPGGWRLGSPRSVMAVGGLVLAVGMIYGCARVTWNPIPSPTAVPDPRSLPVLPAISSGFEGVPLAEYIGPPAVTGDQLDELLASPVLRDPEFAQAVHWWVGYWTVSASDWFPGFLNRMATGGSAVDSALASRGFLPSLRYLPLIESGYDPGVTSRAGAVGLWQLMPTTARWLGLEVSPSLDERIHPEKSTVAALGYLEDLHNEFGSWFVALAAYNSGPTRVRGILRRQAPTEPRTDSLFWSLRDHFPRETREFLPKLYGAMWVASQPEAYGYGADAQRPLPSTQ